MFSNRAAVIPRKNSGKMTQRKGEAEQSSKNQEGWQKKTAEAVMVKEVKKQGKQQQKQQKLQSKEVKEKQ